MEKTDEIKFRILKQFLIALKDPNPNLRFLALEGIHSLSIPIDASEIVPLLNDNDRFVKWKAILTCGGLHLKKAFPELKKLLFSPDMNTRAFAALSLGHLSCEESARTISETFEKESSPKVRQTIIRSFGYLKEFPQWETLSKGAKDNDLGVRLDLSRILGEMAPDQNALDILLNLLEQESNNHVFATAILGLGRFSKPILLGYFQHSLQHQEPRIRANAIEAMGTLSFELIEKIIFPYLKDSSNRVKANVISIFLKNNFHDRMMPELKKLLASENRWERASGAWLAGKFRVMELIQELVKLLGDTEGVVAERTAWALGCLKSPDTFSALLSAFKHGNQWALIHIIRSMGETASPENIPAIVFLLEKERNPLLKAAFIEVISSLKYSKAFDIVCPMRLDPDVRIRMSAYNFLGNITPEKSGELLFEGLNDSNVKVRALCADLMIKAGDLRAMKTLSTILKDPDKLQRVQSFMTLKELAVRASKE
ncbi:MAG: HEAT repeat domain-containing protein [Candidatus Riflebacteria bacterium]|nr:HEAT repeat domain-containing protein [Candidatus Riflebacteria bacterium]